MDTGHEHKDYSYLNDRWERERKERIKELEKENEELKQRLETGQHETIVIGTESDEGDWYCPKCKAYIVDQKVTYEETCDTCGAPCQWHGSPYGDCQ